MTLFTKLGCEKCDYVKSHVDLESLEVTVEELGPDNPDALAHLAWHGLVNVAERALPILVLDQQRHITGAIRIRKFLEARGHA